MRNKFNLITLIILLVFSHVYAQTDFNEYKTLKSQGTIPQDFSSLTYKKIQEDLKTGKENLSKSQEKIFFQGIHYGIDDILHSGMVIYGDEVSNYVQKIAEKLLSEDETLFNKLRFYTLKSNETNAFSTDQGMIFVTTGLISQLTSEAQLAFVLAHEISHYTQKHVVETFEYKANQRRSLGIRDLSFYSKEKEFEADKLGLKLYNKAGYSKAELVPSFDVLMYSYLPFDEVEFPKSYISTDNMFVPDNIFPDKKYEIKAEEDYDDSKSSHPNIKKRKETIENEIVTFNNWGNTISFFGEQKFIFIRQLCRFESVRTDILNSNYADAIYSIFLLEKIYPSSLYLNRMKAQAWLGLAQYKKNGSINETVDKTADLEGEIATVHYFIKKMSKDALLTLALRKVFDVKQKYNSDKQIDAIYRVLIKELSSTSSFKIENYSKKTYTDAWKEFNEKKAKSAVVSDTVVQTKSSSKYDKIKSKKNIDNSENFDSTKYYLYGISDIITDSNFSLIYKEDLAKNQKEKEDKEEFDKLSYKQQKKIRKKNEETILNLGINELIIVEPMVFSYKKEKLDLIKSEKLKHDFSEVIENTAIETDLKVYTLDRDHLEKKGTDVYNERSVMFSFMEQISREDNFNLFPVDFSELEEIKLNYGTSKVLFTWVSHEYKSKINGMAVFGSLFIYPFLTFYIPYGILSGHNTELNIVILDIDKGSVDLGESFYFKDKPKTLSLGAHMFSIFNKLKKQPTNNK